MMTYVFLSLKTIKIDDEDPFNDWDKLYDWCDDRFENKWMIVPKPQGLFLRVNGEIDLTEFKLVWL